MSDIDILEPKNETKTSFYYLKDKINELFTGYLNIFDSNLKNVFKDIPSEEEKNINYNLLSKEISLPSKDAFSFFDRYGDLYEYCFALFEENIYADDIKSEQIKFLKDLVNGYKVHKRFERFKHINDLYLNLHANARRTVHDIFLKNPTDKYNKKIYLQAKILFDLTENFFEKLLHKGIIKNNLNQSDIKYDENIAERTKLRRQGEEENIRNEDGLIDYNKLMRLISLRKKDINMELFKKYFSFQMPTEMLKALYVLSDKNKNGMLVSMIKTRLSDLKNGIKKMSEDEIIIEKPNKIVDIVEKILKFNQQIQ